MLWIVVNEEEEED